MEQPRGFGGGPRPRALFVSADLPWPPEGGARIATLGNLQAFGRQYETDLVTLAAPGRRSEHLRTGASLPSSDRHPQAVHFREAPSWAGSGGCPQSLLDRAVSAQEVSQR